MKPVAWQRRSDGLAMRVGQLSLRLAWQAPGIVRVAAVPIDAGEPGRPYGPMLDPLRRPQRVRFEVHESPTEIVTTDGVMSVHIDTVTGVFSYRDSQGQVILREGAK